ncbi:MAG TPA: ribose 5-phosphate isomerase B [Thermoleophilia bacterium]|nr:ribose 5-phosphate isomerase B [Thermoleophilia bacterium]
MRYAVGCDHAGLPLKAPLVAELERQGHEITDFGTDGPESVDYPLFAARVARAVRDGDADRGLLLCGTGLGMAMTANRFRGVRAASVSESFSARMARAHNDANVLCMGGRVVGPGAAIEILRTWLEQGFEGGRHQRRVDMVMHPDGSD